MKQVKKLISAVLMVGMFGGTAFSATQIEWWHAMGGALGETVNTIVGGFNRSQTEYVMKAVCKGNYTETMTAAVAAFRVNLPLTIPPEHLHVFDADRGSRFN